VAADAIVEELVWVGPRFVIANVAPAPGFFGELHGQHVVQQLDLLAIAFFVGKKVEDVGGWGKGSVAATYVENFRLGRQSGSYANCVFSIHGVLIAGYRDGAAEG
jgi:hypothetical protein